MKILNKTPDQFKKFLHQEYTSIFWIILNNFFFKNQHFKSEYP